MRVVLLEDEPIWAAEVGETVRRHGWRLRWFDTIARFEAGFDPHETDVLLLDIHMGPDSGDGLDLLRRLRAGGTQTPVLMLTSFPDWHEPEALLLGADTYLSKPFNPAVLAGRINVLVRRLAHADPSRLAIGLLAISLHHRTAQWASRPMPLTPQSFALLARLMQANGAVVAPLALWRAVWPHERHDVRGVVLHVAIARLRAEMGLVVAAKQLVATVARKGYRIDTDAAACL